MTMGARSKRPSRMAIPAAVFHGLAAAVVGKLLLTRKG